MNSENIDQLITALSKAQGEMSSAAKDSSNPFFNSKYADLNSVWNACRDALSNNGLAVIQTMHKDDVGEQYLKTTLGHASGQWICSILPIRVKIPEVPELDKYGKPKKVNELQVLGSCLTYLRRYALAAIVGVAPDEDDDGNSQMREHPKANTAKQPSPLLDMTKEEAMMHLARYNGDSIMILQFLLHRCDKFKTKLKEEVDSFIASESLAMAEFALWKDAQAPKKKTA